MKPIFGRPNIDKEKTSASSYRDGPGLNQSIFTTITPTLFSHGGNGNKKVPCGPAKSAVCHTHPDTGSNQLYCFRQVLQLSGAVWPLRSYALQAKENR